MRKRKLFGILAYLLFLFAVVEIALQTFYYITAGDFLFRRVALPLYQAESFAGYRNRPELSFEHHTNEFRAHYYTNRAGFRVSAPGVEYSVRKPADTYRILILGSSVAYGWGVNYDKSLAALLPQLLEARGFAKGRKIEVINTGVPAMPPAPQLNWYRHVGRKYQPDLVLQFVYGSMAVSGNPASNFVVDDSGHLKATGLSTAQRWRERAKQLATVFYGWVLWTQIDARLSPTPVPTSPPAWRSCPRACVTTSYGRRSGESSRPPVPVATPCTCLARPTTAPRWRRIRSRSAP